MQRRGVVLPDVAAGAVGVVAAEAVGAGGDAAEVALMLLADGRWPAGSHAHSGGLEPALMAGMPAADIRAYLRTRLATVVRVEAATAVVTLHRLHAGLRLAEVEQAWAARTPSQAVRGASQQVGRGHLRLLRRLWPDHPVTSAVGATPSRAVALGALGAVLGLSPAQLARLVAYEDVQSVAAAALKLAPLDPADTLAWTLELRPEIAQVVSAVCGSTDPDDIPALGAPLLEQWAQAHARASRRLFRA